MLVWFSDNSDGQSLSQTYRTGKVKNNTFRKHALDRDWTIVVNKFFTASLLHQLNQYLQILTHR